MKYLPEGDPDIHKADARHRPAHPAGSNYSLQRVHAGLARDVQEKIVAAPVAQSKRVLRNPRQEDKQKAEYKQQADFEPESDIEDGAGLWGHS